MENFLRDRIRGRLDALGMNPFDAARRIGAERTFINDLLIGKKDSIRRAAIPRVAEVLDCDPEFLIGAQDTPRRAAAQTPPRTPENGPLAGAAGVPLFGIAEAGTWRHPRAYAPSATLPLATDPRYPPQDQIAYLTRGDHAAWLGATDGAVILAVKGADFRDGDVVVVRRTRPGDDGPEVEITLRKVTDGLLILPDHKPVTIGNAGVEIFARAISAHKVF